MINVRSVEEQESKFWLVFWILEQIYKDLMLLFLKITNNSSFQLFKVDIRDKYLCVFECIPGYYYINIKFIYLAVCYGKGK